MNTGDSILYATEEDESRAVENAVKHAQCSSLDELITQADSGIFESYEARSAWFGIATLVR